ncbi:ligase-associated DNA damage response exonuclease [Olivibacter ginsenosidimutans]|uniref:Ligase-associated DNA damage response exonuclease n=1 Tax=Olivibacter ginsenosidimutans TaxID=1176537 RepID=A0ABP9BMA1_9SPHI
MKLEIKTDFLQLNEKGLYCPYGEFYLDAQRAVDKVVVSHGHGDHIVAGCREIFSTVPTRFFMEHRFGKNAGKHFHTFPYGKEFLIKEVALTFFPAGHILGSALVLMVYQGTRYLYSGDYKLQSDETCEAIQLVKADVFITESTFASPSVKHPDAIQEIKKLNAINHPILLGAYALGKAQRLTALIHTHCPDKQVLIHHAILPFHKLYDQLGALHWNYLPYNRKLMKDNPNRSIYIVPPLTFNSYIKAKNVIRVFASGWARLQKGNQLALFISDHVDWDDIIATVTWVEPKEIWTLHGDGSALQDYYNTIIPVKQL